jgi:hypothetical protein
VKSPKSRSKLPTPCCTSSPARGLPMSLPLAKAVSLWLAKSV